MITRLDIQFNNQQNQSLNKLACELGITKAEVIKTAIALLKVAIQEKKNGNHIGIFRNDSVIKEIVGF